MIAFVRFLPCVALVAFALLSGCVAPASQGAISAQKDVTVSTSSIPVVSDAPASGVDCGANSDAMSNAFAAAAQVVITEPVACTDLGPGGSLVAGCEGGTMTTQPLTCAAIKPSAMERYAACVSSGARMEYASRSLGEQSCKTPSEIHSVKRPQTYIEVGSPTGPGYILKTNDLTLVRSVTPAGVREITSRTNPDRSRVVETRAFTATYNSNGKLSSVTWK